MAVRPAGPLWFAVDSSAYPRLAAVTSPDRTYVHHPSLQVNGSPRILAWNWQWIAQAGTAPTSWTAPLDAARVPSGQTASRLAAGQVRDLVARLGDTGEVPLFIFDAGYDATGLAMDLHHGPDPVRCQVLVRLARSRMFYTGPAPRRPGARGRPATHGPVFRCADPGTWPVPWQDLSWDDPVCGRVRARAWAPVHPRINAARDQPGHIRQAPRPVIRGTVIRAGVERLRGVPRPAFLWLWHSGPDAPDPAGCARAYLRRYDIEHTLRFVRQDLGWTAPALRTPAQAQVWTWLVIAAFTQLRLARPLADARLPWDHSARPVTPARVRRAFRALRAILGTPAGPPKPSGRSPGRPPGRRSAPGPCHHVISKTPRKPAKRKKTRKARKARTTPATPKS